MSDDRSHKTHIKLERIDSMEGDPYYDYSPRASDAQTFVIEGLIGTGRFKN